MGLRERRAIFPTRNVVVYNNFFPFAIFTYLHTVDAKIVLSVGQEKLSDATRMFRQHREHRKEVAVTEEALLDITGRNLIHENLQTAIVVVELRNICGAHPLELSPHAHFIFDFWIFPVAD